MAADPRERLLGGRLAEIDVRERFVVAQDDVVGRPVTLDQVAFEQQRLDVVGGGHHLEAAGQRHHALQPCAQRRGLGIGRQALLQRFRLADVEHLALGVEHAIDARAVGQGRDLLADHRRTGQNRCARAGCDVNPPPETEPSSARCCCSCILRPQILAIPKPSPVSGIWLFRVKASIVSIAAAPVARSLVFRTGAGHGQRSRAARWGIQDRVGPWSSWHRQTAGPVHSCPGSATISSP